MRLSLIASLAFLLFGCGGGSSSHVPSPTPGPAGTPIDPSGNWSMVATDAGGKSVQFASLFAQVGVVVTSSSFTAVGNPAPFSCVPFTASLTGGEVQNLNTFVGTVTFENNVGGFTFSATLTPDGKSFSGTYSGMAPCTGLLTAGTFTGAEMPSATGSWTGTLTPCLYDGQTAICTPTGPATPFAASLSQDDVTGNVTGHYQINGDGFTTGIVAVDAADQDILSGTVWQFTMTDDNGTKTVVNGLLDKQGGFIGLAGVVAPGSPHFALAISH